MNVQVRSKRDGLSRGQGTSVQNGVLTDLSRLSPEKGVTVKSNKFRAQYRVKRTRYQYVFNVVRSRLCLTLTVGCKEAKERGAWSAGGASR